MKVEYKNRVVDQVDIHVTKAFLENQTLKEQIARIVIENTDGREAVFFVSVGINKQGQPKVELAHNVDNGCVRKDVRGFWWKRS